jgi:hypothetical protein
LRVFRILVISLGIRNAGEIRQSAPDSVKTNVDWDEVQPRNYSRVKPLPEKTGPQRKAATSEERQKTSTEPCSVKVKQKPMGPVCLEVDPGASSQLITLSLAVSTTSNLLGNSHVCTQIQLFGWGRSIHDLVLVNAMTGG